MRGSGVVTKKTVLVGSSLPFVTVKDVEAGHGTDENSK